MLFSLPMQVARYTFHFRIHLNQLSLAMSMAGISAKETYHTSDQGMSNSECGMIFWPGVRHKAEAA